MSHLLDKIDFRLFRLNVLKDVFFEVAAAQWALSLDLKPLLTAHNVEVMLIIAREDDYLVAIAEG